jgi:beta-lactamase superfamily II metal-dependent hydrolase
MFEIDMLPAGNGDCLVVIYGDAKAPNVVVIDGGVKGTGEALKGRLEALRKAQHLEELVIELLVVTHIDNDHIVGVLELLDDDEAKIEIKDLWFNGTRQLLKIPLPDDDSLGGNDSDGDECVDTPSDMLGPSEGEDLSNLILKSKLPWNRVARRRPIASKDKGALFDTVLDGGLTVTVLGPPRSRLQELRKAWEDKLGEVTDDMLGKNDTWPPTWLDGEGKDPSHTNPSSIALLIEYKIDDKKTISVLLAGDARADDLAGALHRVATARDQKRVSLSAFKVSHHASINNISKELMDAMSCSNYLISTNGVQHEHPDNQAILRILRHSEKKVHLFFNTETEKTANWRVKKSDIVPADYRDYDTTYPDDPKRGIRLVLA